MLHFVEFKSKPKIALDDQHGEFKLLDLAVVSSDEKAHAYIHNYAIWLLNRMSNKHD